MQQVVLGRPSTGYIVIQGHVPSFLLHQLSLCKLHPLMMHAPQPNPTQLSLSQTPSISSPCCPSQVKLPPSQNRVCPCFWQSLPALVTGHTISACGGRADLLGGARLDASHADAFDGVLPCPFVLHAWPQQPVVCSGMFRVISASADRRNCQTRGHEDEAVVEFS